MKWYMQKILLMTATIESSECTSNLWHRFTSSHLGCLSDGLGSSYDDLIPPSAAHYKWLFTVDTRAVSRSWASVTGVNRHKILRLCTCQLHITVITAKTQPITQANRKHLEGFHRNCLGRILNTMWKDKLKNASVRRKGDQSLLEEDLAGLVMCSVWKMPVVLGKQYTGYQLERGKEEDRWLHGET